MKNIQILDKVYDRLKEHAEKEGEEIEMIASVIIGMGITERERTRKQLLFNDAEQKCPHPIGRC